MHDIHTRPVRIPVEHGEIEGMLALPDQAQGIVLFAHGSGSSRHSPRNNAVARALRQAGMATLLVDLLTPEEDAHYQTRFDIGLLTVRLLAVTQWLSSPANPEPHARSLPLGYFGASTGAAAALQAAARLGMRVGAVVSRGGRPDLAGRHALERVCSPTLLLVGSLDHSVLELNRQAYDFLVGVKRLEIIDGATHLFEEPGTLEQVAQLAAAWFTQYLVAAA